MQLTTGTRQFAAALSTAASITKQKGTHEYVLIDATESGITLSATNGETSIQLKPMGTVDKEGRAAVNARRLLSILKELTGDEVDLRIDGEKLEIECGGSFFTIVGIDPYEFPAVEPVSQTNYVRVDSGELKTAISRTQFACDPTSLRAHAGVLFDRTEDGVNLVATDARRLSVAPLTTYGDGDCQSAVIPQEALRLVASNLGTDDEITVYFAKSSVAFESDKFLITTRLIEGRFPQWQPIMAGDHPIAVELPREDFAACIRQSMVLRTEEKRGVGFRLFEGTLMMRAEAESGVANIELGVSNHEDDFGITLDPAFIGDFVRLANSDFITWRITDWESPVLFESGTWRYVVMPLSTGEESKG